MECIAENIVSSRGRKLGSGRKTERLDLRVTPQTIEALQLLKQLPNYNVVSTNSNFTENSISDILEFGVKLVCASYLNHSTYTGIYPDVEFQYDGYYGNQIVKVLDHLQEWIEPAKIK